MDRKTTGLGSFTVKSEATGEFEAVFCTTETIDKDGDVITSGAFESGATVKVASWGHNWGSLPVGKGTIREVGNEAIVSGRLFLDSEAGRETWAVLRELGPSCDWSFGFDVLDSELGRFAGQQVRFLRKLKVHEVSPVMVGAGVNTRTLVVKQGRRNAAADVQRLEEIGSLAQRITELVAELTDGPIDGEPEPKGRKLADLQREVATLMGEPLNPRVEAIRCEVLALR
jgi:hypothetical protein